MSRVIEDLNTGRHEMDQLTEQTDMEIMSGLTPVLATPAYALGAGAVLGAAGLGFAVEEVLGD